MRNYDVRNVPFCKCLAKLDVRVYMCYEKRPNPVCQMAQVNSPSCHVSRLPVQQRSETEILMGLTYSQN